MPEVNRALLSTWHPTFSRIVNDPSLQLDLVPLQPVQLSTLSLKARPKCFTIAMSDLVAAPTLDPPWDVEDVRSKLMDCVKRHSCGSPKGLPSRLLDVGDPNTDYIKLVETSTETINDSRYAALSYCWGISAPFTTESSTLESRLQGFSVSEMPLTLRESVQVVRDLGIRYLWIDALCILQGNEKDDVARADWQKESARMQEVYGNAFLTIVAASSSDSQGGLINRRLSYTLRDQNQGLNLTASKQNATVFLGPPGANSNAESKVNIHSEPISSRAWALQEWILSNRLLVFTTTRIQFICYEHKMRAFHAAYNFRLPRSPSMPRERDWQKIVINFCARNMTKLGDKLPALSGLAKRFSALTNGKWGGYLAGLWRTTIVNDLAWRRERPDSGRTMFLAIPNKSGRCPNRAPSWSWASIDGIVTFSGGMPSDLVKIKECYTEPAVGHDHFGQVKSGTLAVQCLYKEASIISHGEDLQLCDASGSIFALFLCDDLSEINELVDKPPLNKESKLYCLGISVSNNEWEGVVARFDSTKNAFVRIGYFLTICNKGFSTSEVMDFIII